jgi:hypothetical protein
MISLLVYDFKSFRTITSPKNSAILCYYELNWERTLITSWLIVLASISGSDWRNFTTWVGLRPLSFGTCLNFPSSGLTPVYLVPIAHSSEPPP